MSCDILAERIRGIDVTPAVGACAPAGVGLCTPADLVGRPAGAGDRGGANREGRVTGLSQSST